jgi:hypothetical protein
MTTLATLPKRSGLERLSLGLALALTVVGLGTLLGWWLQWPELLQPFADKPAMKANAALGFFAAGMVLLAFELGWKRLGALALVPLVFGALTLVQGILSANLYVDEMLVRDHLLIGTEHAGRMPMLVALCLILAGTTLLWQATERAARARLFAEAVIGSLLASAGFSTLLGYAAGLPAVYYWGTATATAPVGAIALLLLGMNLTLLAWRKSMKEEGGPPTSAPMPAVIGCLTLTLILWIGLRERAFALATIQSHMDRIAIQMKDDLDREASQFERIARRWGDGPSEATAVWKIDARTQMTEASEQLGCIAIAMVDLDLSTIWI